MTQGDVLFWFFLCIFFKKTELKMAESLGNFHCITGNSPMIHPFIHFLMPFEVTVGLSLSQLSLGEKCYSNNHYRPLKHLITCCDNSFIEKKNFSKAATITFLRLRLWVRLSLRCLGAPPFSKMFNQVCGCPVVCGLHDDSHTVGSLWKCVARGLELLSDLWKMSQMENVMRCLPSFYIFLVSIFSVSKQITVYNKWGCHQRAFSCICFLPWL